MLAKNYTFAQVLLEGVKSPPQLPGRRKARQAKEQVVGIIPGLDDNPFKNNIIDHGKLHLPMRPNTSPVRVSRPMCVRHLLRQADHEWVARAWQRPWFVAQAMVNIQDYRF